MDRQSVGLFVFSMIMSLIVLIYIVILKNKTQINAIVDGASTKSAFSPAVFKIYDRSTEEVCDRLIIVSPFYWEIWACRGELYILNPEGGINCGANQTAAIRVFEKQFVETCLTLNYDSILRSYTSLQPKIVPYEIESKTFTILSALNILVKEWITFDVSAATERVTINEIPSKRRKRSANCAKKVGKTDPGERSQHSVLSATGTLMGREIRQEDVVTLTSQGPYSHADLIDAYFRAMENATVRVDDYRTIDPKVPDYITLMQNAKNSNEYRPQLIRD